MLLGLPGCLCPGSASQAITAQDELRQCVRACNGIAQPAARPHLDRASQQSLGLGSAGYHHAARATLPKPIVPVQNAVTLLGLLGYLSWRDHH